MCVFNLYKPLHRNVLVYHASPFVVVKVVVPERTPLLWRLLPAALSVLLLLAVPSPCNHGDLGSLCLDVVDAL